VVYDFFSYIDIIQRQERSKNILYYVVRY